MITNVLSHVMTMLVIGLYVVEMVSMICMSSKDHLFTDRSIDAKMYKHSIV